MPTFSSVFSAYPGRVALTPAEAGAAVFGWCGKTVANRLHAGTFPLPLVTVGGKQVVPLSVLAELLGETPPAPLVAPVQLVNGPSRRQRGRPRKNGGTA